jgi:hypothetical protein
MSIPWLNGVHAARAPLPAPGPLLSPSRGRP